MTSSTRTALFVLWLAAVALLCLGHAYGASRYVTQILCCAGLPFLPTDGWTQPMDRRAGIVVIGVTIGVAVLLIVLAPVGASKASNDWFESSGVRVWFALGIWIVLSVGGWIGFRAGRFLARRH